MAKIFQLNPQKMNKKSVLILGGGLLGQTVTKVFNTGEFSLVVAKRGGSNTSFSNKDQYFTLDCEIKNGGSNIFDYFKYFQFDYIINTIGITPNKIDNSCTKSKLEAININSVFPYKLATEFPESKIIHVSTDSVFGINSGKNENSPPTPLTVYEQSKAMGEVWSENVMNLRCSIVGPDSKGSGLLEWFKKERREKGVVHGYTDHTWNGVTSLQLAQIMRGIIRDDLFCGGIQHIIPNGKVTKFELLELFNLYPWGLDDKVAEIIETKSNFPIDRNLTTARITNNMLLWKSAGSIAPLDIQTMIRNLAYWVEE